MLLQKGRDQEREEPYQYDESKLGGGRARVYIFKGNCSFKHVSSLRKPGVLVFREVTV